MTNFQCGLLTLLAILDTETKRACYNSFMHTHRRQCNFFAFRSSPPLRNAGISRHSSIWCTLVSHPVNRCKLPCASVISPRYCHANLKKRFFLLIVSTKLFMQYFFSRAGRGRRYMGSSLIYSYHMTEKH